MRVEHSILSFWRIIPLNCRYYPPDISTLLTSFVGNESAMETIKLAEEINETADTFINLISRFDNNQLNTIPFQGSWTAGQVADHIIKATSGLPDERTRSVARPPDEQVEGIKSVFLDFSLKFQSPDFIVPGAGPFDIDYILHQLSRVKKQNAATAMTEDTSKLCLDLELPGFGYLTRYEWLQFSVYHTQRHIHQLKNISEKILPVQL